MTDTRKYAAAAFFIWLFLGSLSCSAEKAIDRETINEAIEAIEASFYSWDVNGIMIEKKGTYFDFLNIVDSEDIEKAFLEQFHKDEVVVASAIWKQGMDGSKKQYYKLLTERQDRDLQFTESSFSRGWSSDKRYFIAATNFGDVVSATVSAADTEKETYMGYMPITRKLWSNMRPRLFSMLDDDRIHIERTENAMAITLTANESFKIKGVLLEDPLFYPTKIQDIYEQNIVNDIRFYGYKEVDADLYLPKYVAQFSLRDSSTGIGDIFFECYDFITINEEIKVDPLLLPENTLVADELNATTYRITFGPPPVITLHMEEGKGNKVGVRNKNELDFLDTLWMYGNGYMRPRLLTDEELRATAMRPVR